MRGRIALGRSSRGRGRRLRVMRRAGPSALGGPLLSSYLVALGFGVVFWITNFFLTRAYRCVWLEDVYRSDTHGGPSLQFVLLAGTLAFVWWLLAAVVDARVEGSLRQPAGLAAASALAALVAGLALTQIELGGWIDEDVFRRHGDELPQRRLAFPEEWPSWLGGFDYCRVERDAFGSWRVEARDGGASWQGGETLRFDPDRTLRTFDASGGERLDASWRPMAFPGGDEDRDRLRTLRVPGPGPLHVGAGTEMERPGNVWIFVDRSALLYRRRFLDVAAGAAQELVLLEQYSELRRGHRPPSRLLLVRADARGEGTREKWFAP